MQLNRITERTYFTPCDARTDRPNLGYVLGDSMAVMIDSGNSPVQAASFLEAVERDGLPRPSVLFVTHHHWDHTFGMASLQDSMLTVAGERTNRILKEQTSYTWDAEHLDQYCTDGRIPLFCKPHILLEYPDLSEIRVSAAMLSFEEELRLDIGGEFCRMRRITSGHTSECYYLLAENSKVLFLGDANSEEVVGTDWIDHKAELEQEIRELEEIDFEYALTGHVPVFTREELLSDLKIRAEKAE